MARKQIVRLASKADTLIQLSRVVSRSVIDSFMVFGVAEWDEDPLSIVNKIAEFSPGQPRLLRSSASDEDHPASSMAGHYLTVEIGIQATRAEIHSAAALVINSYSKDGRSPNPADQLFVQQKATDLRCSGVLLTADPRYGSPYYVINYDRDMSRAGGVTSGKVARSIRIPNWLSVSKIPQPWRGLIASVKEIQVVTGEQQLDIEFGVSRSLQVHVFQVRKLNVPPNRLLRSRADLRRAAALVRRQYRSRCRPEESIVFADMPDWNPAEILGDRATNLATSLYQLLITDSVWSKGRESLGYASADGRKLLQVFGNKPYIDCIASFTTLLPASLAGNLRTRLACRFVHELATEPSLQDKIEFSLIPTCLDLQTAYRLEKLKSAGFSSDDLALYSNALAELTNNILGNWRALISTDLDRISRLEAFRRRRLAQHWQSENTRILLSVVKESLNELRELGTYSFVRLARLAFIGLSLIRSFVGKTGVSDNFSATFLSSFSTIASQITQSLSSAYDGYNLPNLAMGFAHLRPGTYDIRSPRLGPVASEKGDSRPTSWRLIDLGTRTPCLSEDVCESISNCLAASGLTAGCDEVMNFAAHAIQARELSKFEFTRTLSDTLELIAYIGSRHKVGREELAHLRVGELLGRRSKFFPVFSSALAPLVEKRRNDYELLSQIPMPALISSDLDLSIVEVGGAHPTFITAKRVVARALRILPHKMPSNADVRGRIVLIDSADPGYDWLFSLAPAALVTKYGGVASHMAIRCYEFALAAAIGCGAALFDQLVDATEISLDCSAGQIHKLI